MCDVCESDWLATEVPLLLIGCCVRGYKSDWLNLTALKSQGTEDHLESGRLRTRAPFGFSLVSFPTLQLASFPTLQLASFPTLQLAKIHEILLAVKTN